MATAEEGEATANTTSSSYGGGGAGGKFRKKPFRRQTTPYDRPSTTLRGNNNTNSWLKKLVVDPASRLISYGAERFFASVFRKRLPPPPPSPQPPGTNTGLHDDVQGEVLNSVVGADLKSSDGVDWKSVDRADFKNISGVDLKTDDILQSQGGVEEPAAADFSKPANGSSSSAFSELELLLKQKKFTRSEIVHLTELLQSRAVEASPGGGHQKNEEIALDENGNERIRSSATLTTPIANSKVLEDDIATPAELAKAYMGNRPSKVPPSALGQRSQVRREDTGLPNNIPFSSESPIMSLTKKSPLGLAAPNGLITPKSRGRSAIYNMARTPYSRIHPTSNLKGDAVNSNGYARPSMHSSYLSLAENDEKFESQPSTIKRRSSIFDDEVGSVGPIRRIKHKSNLLAPKIYHSAYGVGRSQSKQKLPLIGENENPGTSYVPSKSSEVAARIFQHLEKLSPKEKPSESKLVAIHEKSPSKSSPTMLSGKAIRSMEDVGSSKLLLDVQNDHKLGYSLNATLSDARDSSQKQGKVDDNGCKESFIPSNTWNPVMNNDSAASFKGFGPSSRTTDSIVKDGASQPPQKKRAFRMSAQEDYLEQDDDIHCNGLASRPFPEKDGLMKGPTTDSKLVPAEAPKLVKNTNQAEDKTPLGLISRNTSEPGSSGDVTVGEGTAIASFKKPEEAAATSQSVVLSLRAAAFDKPGEANNLPSLFSFSSKIAENFSSLPSESSKMAESQPESSSSLFDGFPSAGSEAKIPEPDTSYQLSPPKAGDINAKSDIVSSAASNMPPVSSSPSVSFTSASSNSINIGIANFGSTSSVFGLTTKPSTSAGPAFNAGSSVVPSSALSVATTEVGDQRTKPKTDPSSRTSNFGSVFASAGKSQDSSSVNSRGPSVQLSSSASLLSFHTNGSSPFGASLNSSLFSSNKNFGFSSSASSSDATAVVTSTGPTSNPFKFGSTSSPLPESTTATFGSGLNSLSSSTKAVLSSTSATPTFNFGANASASGSAIYTASSLSSGSSSTFGFCDNSSTSSANAVRSSPSATPTFNFGANVSAIAINTASSLSSGSSSTFGFGANSSTSFTNAVGSSTNVTPTFNFSANSSASASLINTASTLTSSSSSTFSFGLNPSSSFTANSNSSNAAPNVFGSSFQSEKSPLFSSSFSSPSPSTGFAFGSTSSSSPFHSFTSANASVSTSPNLSQPAFGNTNSTGFAASPGNNDQMNTEDSMSEDPVQSAASAPVPIFGQPAVATTPGGFAFGSTAPSQASPFMFGGQQNQLAPPQNPSFQASGSFTTGGSFSLGSGGGDKSSRKIIKVNRNKNRRK